MSAISWTEILRYAIAFAFGFIVAMQTSIFKNSAQIRRANETIRRRIEADMKNRVR